MKNDPLYTYYIYYLNSKLLEGKISRGSYSLLLISLSYFKEFKLKFESNEIFSKVFKRDKRLNNLINE